MPLSESGWRHADVCKNVLKCIILAPGGLFVMMNLNTQQQELFATFLYMDTSDVFSITAIVTVVDKFGWTMFNAMEQK